MRMRTRVPRSGKGV